MAGLAVSVSGLVHARLDIAKLLQINSDKVDVRGEVIAGMLTVVAR
jgi:hypothetical protein